MFLEDSPFYKDSRVWRENFIKIIGSNPRRYWDSIVFDIDAYVDKTYMLYLPSRVDKIKNAKEELQRVKTKNSTLLDSITWWEGFYGKTEWDENLHNPEYSFDYVWNIDPDPKVHKKLGRQATERELKNLILSTSTAESNIALGHVSILQDIVKNNIQHALILEDDIKLSAGFAWLMEKMLKQLPPDWDMFYVSYEPCYYGFKSEPYAEDIIKVESGVWWMSGVFISQRAAQKLLDNLPVIGPIDVWINYHMDGLNVFSSKYNCIGQNESLKSDNMHSYKYVINNISDFLDS